MLTEMIDRGWVQAIVSDRRAHDPRLRGGRGHCSTSSTAPQHATTKTLYARGYNRVYDTIELEKNLDDTERVLHEGAGGPRPRGHGAVEPPDHGAAGRVPGQERRGARGAEERVRARRADLRTGLHRLGARPRPGDLQPAPGPPDGSHPPLRSVPRPGRLRRAHPTARDARHLHHRRGRAAQLGAAGRPLPRDPARPAGQRRARAPLQATRSASAPSPSTGAACRAAPTPRACRGASSCPSPRAVASPRSSPTPPSPGRSWCAPCSSVSSGAECFPCGGPRPAAWYPDAP